MAGELGNGARPTPASRASADELREQQAIAAALLVGEEMRREERKQLHQLARRLGVFCTVMAVIGLLILFAYARIRQDFSPTFWMLLIGALGAAAATAAYWGYAEGRRE
jgi:hypothetical protein